jgi:hypothetical protein
MFAHGFDSKLLPILKEHLHKFPSVKVSEWDEEFSEFSTENLDDHNRLINILYRKDFLKSSIEDLIENLEEWEDEFEIRFNHDERKTIKATKEMIKLTKEWLESE